MNTIAAEARQFSQLVAGEVRVRVAKSGLTAADVARVTRIPTKEVSACLSGERPLLLDELADLADLVASTPSEIARSAAESSA